MFTVRFFFVQKYDSYGLLSGKRNFGLKTTILGFGFCHHTNEIKTEHNSDNLCIFTFRKNLNASHEANKKVSSM